MGGGVDEEVVKVVVDLEDGEGEEEAAAAEGRWFRSAPPGGGGDGRGGGGVGASWRRWAYARMVWWLQAANPNHRLAGQEKIGILRFRYNAI